jgi:hypothetical protein
MSGYQLKQPQQSDQTEESYLDHHRIWLCSHKPTRSPVAKYVVSSFILSTIHAQIHLVQESKVLFGRVEVWRIRKSKDIQSITNPQI